MTNRREFMSSAVLAGRHDGGSKCLRAVERMGRGQSQAARPHQSRHPLRDDQLHLGPAARHRVGHQENRRARAAGHRALSEQHRAVSEEPDGRSRRCSTTRASRSSTARTARRDNPRTSSIPRTRRRPSPITWRSRATFCSRSARRLWKCNMGQRPAGGPSDDQLKRLADTLNEIGRQTIDDGDSDGAASAHLGPDRTRAAKSAA